MSRSQYARQELGFSLFPFLDALSGVIGVLALIIAAMAAIGLQSSKQVIKHPHDETAKSPTYVECQQDALVLHPEKTVVPVSELSSGANAWRRLIGDLRRSRDNYIVLLIRPQGYTTFTTAFNEARQAGLEIGFDAVYGDGEIEIQ